MKIKNVLITLGIIFIIANIIACSSGTNPDSSKAQKVGEDTEKADNADKGKEVDKVFKIGETVELDNVELTILAMAKVKGGEYDEKKQGKEFITVNVKLKNVSTKERIRFDNLDFKIEDSKGIITDKAYLSTVKETESVELAPNAEVIGKIPFEVPENDPKLTLEYQENFLIDNVIRVALNY